MNARTENTHSPSRLPLLAVSGILAALMLGGCQVEALRNAEINTPFQTVSASADHWLMDTTLSFSYTPLDPSSLLPEPAAPTEVATATMEDDEEDSLLRVRPRKTAWGLPWDRRGLVFKLDRILEDNGVANPEARIKMISHAVVASGWRQNVWNYNAWGVQRGSWDGPFYEMFTVEMNDDGALVEVPDAQWRAFASWEDSVRDFNERITDTSQRPSYRQAYRHLVSDSRRSCAAYWSSLGDGNYYTADGFTPGKFAALCWYVRQMLDS